MIARILAVDPGTTKSGWAILQLGRVLDSGVHDNADVLRWVCAGQGCQALVLEDMVAMGMPAGQDVLTTAKWLGRFAQTWDDGLGLFLLRKPALFLPRREVKTYLCGTQQAKDANVRRALIDLFPRTGGGSEPAIGTKSKPGPLYGVSSHAWSAVAVGVTAAAKWRWLAVLPVLGQVQAMELAA